MYFAMRLQAVLLYQPTPFFQKRRHTLRINSSKAGHDVQFANGILEGPCAGIELSHLQHGIARLPTYEQQILFWQ